VERGRRTSPRLPARAWILAARALLLDSEHCLQGAGLLVVGTRIERVFRSRRALLRARGNEPCVELGEHVLIPGLIDAHAHLELGALHGCLPARRGFVPWIRALVRARARLSPETLAASVRAGARELLASGTTTAGDIDSTGTTSALAHELGLRLVVYRELLDAGDGTRTARALARLRRPLAQGGLVREGLAPHAPYTTSSALLEGARRLAHERGLPVTVHWSECSEELEWLERGRGPLARLLRASPRRRGLELLLAARLLTRRTALVHGNLPRPGEPELLARTGVTLVHCPGTQAFFARPPFPLARYLRAGVPLALGTDSLASNRGLSMTREMQLARETLGARPAQVFCWATAGAARALGLERSIGTLRPGRQADMAAFALRAADLAGTLEELTGTAPRAAAAWVAGRQASGTELRDLH
jgi:5-methylthioadenosine/S-adenosylhomocysteine deaminase